MSGLFLFKDADNKKMRVLGLEPRTYGLKGRCSTN